MDWDLDFGGSAPPISAQFRVEAVRFRVDRLGPRHQETKGEALNGI